MDDINNKFKVVLALLSYIFVIVIRIYFIMHFFINFMSRSLEISFRKLEKYPAVLFFTYEGVWKFNCDPWEVATEKKKRTNEF